MSVGSAPASSICGVHRNRGRRRSPPARRQDSPQRPNHWKIHPWDSAAASRSDVGLSRSLPFQRSFGLVRQPGTPLFLLFISLRNIRPLVKWKEAKPCRIFLPDCIPGPKPGPKGFGPVAIRPRNVYIYTKIRPPPQKEIEEQWIRQTNFIRHMYRF